MRKILRKITKKEELTNSEHEELLYYIDKLRETSPESYYIFYDKYAKLLYLKYNILLPKYTWDIDNFINYLINNPILYEDNKAIPIASFPSEARPYLVDNFGDSNIIIPSYILNILEPEIVSDLPTSRENNIIIKYEEANPFKETGLKYHFDRLAKYSFITRLQTYRYLTKNKAGFDRFEIVSPDCLGGIFTNKEKSIYYYLFLTESNINKAKNAATLLNYSFYGRIEGA